MAPCWRSPIWMSQAEAEGLTLLEAENKAGYFGVHHPQQVQALRGAGDARWHDGAPGL